MPKIPISLPVEMPEARAEIEALTARMIRKTASVKAHTRGRLGEVMASSLFPKEIRDRVQLDSAVFETPYGQRRLDNYLPETRQAVESKYLRVVASTRVRKQIDKDRHLLKTGILSKVIWILYYGGSKKAVQYLKESGIHVIDSWDSLSDEVKKDSEDTSRIIKVKV
jgi:hypothetical protein